MSPALYILPIARRPLRAWSCLVFALLATAACAAGPRAAFLDDHCVDCHDAETKKGGLDLTALAWNLSQAENFGRWVKVFDLVTKGEMPPKKKARPPEPARQAFLASLGEELRAFDMRRLAETGRTVLRRLNRHEYERTVHDLLGISTPLARLLPEEQPMHGFDTVAEGLRFSQLQIEKYLEAADAALDAAITFEAEPERRAKRCFLKDEKSVRSHLDKPDGAEAGDGSRNKHRHVLRELPEAIVYFSEGYPSAEIRQAATKTAGRYRIRISGYGYQSQGQPVSMRVYSDNFREKQMLGWFELPPDQPRVVELEAVLPANAHVRIEPSDTGVDEQGKTVYNVPVASFTGPGLALQWVEIEGPIFETWPPVSMARLFGDTPLVKIDEAKKNKWDKRAYELVVDDPKARAQAAIEQFAARAFRRPLEPGEADRFVTLVNDELDAGRPFVEAMRVGFRGVLTAPQFLLFAERPGPLDDYALAARLSYFLWSTMPDEELLALAAQKTLTQPQVLRAQAERMMNDPRFGAFVQNFTGQWLDLRNIDATSPDMRLYPEFDERLRASMVQETEAFFAELVRGNLSVSNLVHSDFAMLNSRLAVHYGIPGVEGEQLRKVPLPPGSPRGGVLTQASVLKVTANGTTTSPVLRGVWVMKKLLGDPPSPPPPDAGTIEPDTRGATTVREQLARHRSLESCAGCHDKIDPPGFALESFDVIGGHRERYRSQGQGDQVLLTNTRAKRKSVKLGPPVDASGELPGGRTFTGIHEYKNALLEMHDTVLSALAKNLVTYATGSAIQFADRPALRTIVEKTREQGSGVRTLIQEVIASPVFQTK
jgi:hypothetical protein